MAHAHGAMQSNMIPPFLPLASNALDLRCPVLSPCPQEALSCSLNHIRRRGTGQCARLCYQLCGLSSRLLGEAGFPAVSPGSGSCTAVFSVSLRMGPVAALSPSLTDPEAHRVQACTPKGGSENSVLGPREIRLWEVSALEAWSWPS